MLMDFNNNFKCQMGREELSHVQFNPRLWYLRPVVKDSGDAGPTLTNALNTHR